MRFTPRYYPNEDTLMHVKRFAILLILLLIVGRWFISNRFPYTHDGENHLARFANYKIALREGQFPPRFAPNLFNHYGYPVFNYNYPLANILSVPFSLLGISYETTFKIIALSFLLAGSFGLSNLLHQLELRGRVVWLSSVLTWLVNPYTISLLYIRGSIGELMAYSLIPWLAWTIELHFRNPPKPSLLPKRKLMSMGLSVAVWAAFFLSHNSTVLFVTPLLMLLAFTRWKQSSASLPQAVSFLASITVAALTSAWFWLPAWFERGAVVVSNTQNQQSWSDQFVTTSQLLFSPVTFGYSLVGSIDSLGLGVGLLLPGALLLITSWLIGRNKQGLRAAHFTHRLMPYLLIVVLSLLMQLQLSEPVWHVLPILRFMQFPWRASLLALSLGAVCVAWAVSVCSARMQKLGLFIIVFSIMPMLQFKPVDFFHRQTIDYDLFAQSTSTQNENRSQNFTYEGIADWQPRPTVVAGSAEITVKSWTGSTRVYQLVAHEKSLIVEPTMHFPGWQTTLKTTKSSRTTKAAYLDLPIVQGRLAYQIDPGEYEVRSRFTQRTPARLIGNAISLLTYVGLCVYTIVQIRRARSL